MSQITNTVVTAFRATGGNVVAQLRSYAAGFGTLGGQINDVTNMSGRLNNQWRAIGTTIRYAVAGTALYGLTSMVSKVSQLNVQLGQMQAIAGAGIGTGPGISNRQMPTLLGGLMNTAVATISPLSQVNDAAVNFLSTVQNVKPSELPQMLQQIGIGAKIAQTPIEDLTQAATTMQIAFGRAVNPTSIGQFSRMWQMLITTAPGGITAAPTIAQSMPGLASMFQLAPGHTRANVGQAQMMALTLGVLRTGMPAATGMRGLTYLLQSIAQPTGGASKALAGIGITPEFVQRHGIFAGVMKLLHTIRPVSSKTAGRLGVMDETALPDVGSSDVASLPGVPAAELTRLRAMIPRIHGIRAAIILSSQLAQHGNVSSIQQDLQNMLQAQDTNSKQSQQLAKAWQQFRQRARLAEAANAINTMGLQVAQTFEPIMGYAAQHVIDPVARAARKHPRATRDITLGATAFLAAMGIGRFVGAGKLPFLRRIPGLSGILGGGGSMYAREQAITAAMGAGGHRAGQTPQDSIFVTVVGQVFGGGTPSPTSTEGEAVNLFKKFGGWGALAGRGLWRFGKAAGPEGLLKLATIPALAYEIHKHGWKQVLEPWTSVGGGITPEHGLTVRGPHGLQTLFPGDLMRMAQRQTGHHVERVLSANEAMWHGQADVNMTIEFTDPHSGKLQRQRVHIPVNLWAGGRHPSHRGQHKTVRSR